LFAWDWHGSDAYEARMPDVLHEVLKGIFDRVVTMWHEMLDRHALAVYEERFRSIPLYPGMKRFTRGLSQLTQLNGADMREIMRVCKLLLLREWSAN
jgi:hypothetical protein